MEVECFEITVGWSICAAPAVPPPTPPPCRVVECIEPAPGHVERKIWALGETMDEDDYFLILFWNVHTWVTEGVSAFDLSLQVPRYVVPDLIR